jgi:predicted Zn-dependent protease
LAQREPAGGGARGSLKDAPAPDDKPPDVTPSTLANWGNTEYNKEIEQRKENNELETNTSVTDQMNRIFDQLKSAALADQEYGAVAKEMDWRLNTIRDKDIAMATAYPGGGVAIYDGVFNVAENEGALAAILGHEMAHVLARHGLKRLAGHVAVAGATAGAATALAMDPKKRERQVIAGITGALALGYLVGGRQAWERTQEHDADCLGLKLAAKAGYDPKKIEGFWRKMEENKEANEKYQFLNDHPIDKDRLDHINKLDDNNTSCMSRSQEVYDQVENGKRQDASATLPGVTG